MQAAEKRVGRPRIHKDDAAKVQAFRNRAKYPSHRHDIYLDEAAHTILSIWMKKSKLSASKTLDAILRGEIQLSKTK